MASGSKHEGNYVLPQAHCKPLWNLRRQVFPWIEEWVARVKARAKGKKWKAGGLQQDDGAADGFLKLMLLLCDVLL